MKKFYVLLIAVLVLFSAGSGELLAQACGSFAATCIPYESRCAATGAIKVFVSGGSGNYKYKVSGTISTNFTSTDSITGLPAGRYTLTATDITTNCTVNIPNIIVPGTYLDPRFTLKSVDVTCDNGNNGSILPSTQSFGRAPFVYSIVAPSPAGIGTLSTTGHFNNLVAGVYTIRLTDSCGGIQSRLVTINNYTWSIDSARFTKFSCDSASGYIRVHDSRNNISTAGGIPGFFYGVVRGPGDTIWSSSASFRFYLGGQNTFEAVAKDPCGKVKKFPVTVSFKPTVSAGVNTYAFTCNSFSAALTNAVNFFSPQYCLTDSSGMQVACNTTGVFTGLAYGSYCIAVHDSCSDTTIRRCFTTTPPPVSVSSTVLISNSVCNSFSAAITGQVGLTSPGYCLYDSANNLLGCNTSGVFDSLAYGTYCISIRDSCRDTTIQRCFTATKPLPYVPDVINPGYTNCYNFGVSVGGTNLTNPLYCILDSAGLVITCNNTGVFDSLLYGNYCVTVYDSCFDSTIIRCFSILGPTIVSDLSAQVTNKACSTFNASISGTNLVDPYFCLYSSDSTLISCDSTGVFDSLLYGSYYVSVHTMCPDTTFYYTISESQQLPSLDNGVTISSRTCANFAVSTSGEQNLTDPQYCLYDSSDTLIACNTTGVFTDLDYGDYCIKVKDGCYDTSIVRCFNTAPLPIAVSVNAARSCSYGFSTLNITAAGAVAPMDVKVYSADGSVFYSGSYNSTTFSVDSVPGSITGETYRVFVVDNCGSIDSATVSAVATFISHSAIVVPKCPSSTWLNGSGSIVATASSNNGALTVRLVKKDNVTYRPALSPTVVAGPVFTFNNLGPGIYIVMYRINDACGNYFYDTLTVSPYQYPSLERSSAYQCDIGGFSIGAVVSNGVGPFSYEVIGSTPALPSIVTAPQASPIFNIDNGTTYSLVRLRALDACGNASLEDASILPLANNGIISDFNCFQLYTTLRVDTLYNSTYAWYVKHTTDGPDSTYIGSTYSIYLPYVTPFDTGLYVCHVAVNSGCIKRSYYYRLDGACYQYLPVELQKFSGVFAGGQVVLNWQVAAEAPLKEFIVERKVSENTFAVIGRVYATPGSSPGSGYRFTDGSPGAGKNYYRLRMIHQNNSTTYSNEILLTARTLAGSINIYPNPAHGVLTIAFAKQTGHQYKIVLTNMVGQPVRQVDYDNCTGGNLLHLQRTKDMAAGVYLLKVFDVTSNESFTQKVIFQ